MIFVGAILGAITGTVAASVIAMGMISLPVMLRYGYDMRIGTGVIAASGTHHPGDPAVAGADRARRPDRRLGRRHVRRRDRPVDRADAAVHAVHPRRARSSSRTGAAAAARGAHAARLAAVAAVLWGMVPSLVLIFLVLGTIFIGLATPTEAGAMGAVGAIVLAVAARPLPSTLMWQAMRSTMRITAMVVFILIGATVFSLVFQGVNGGRWIEHLLSDLPGGRVGFLIFVNLFVFFLAFFLDFFEIVFIVVPLLVPVAQTLGIDLVWFGLLLCVNMQTSFMHPPFGFALFYLRGIAPKEVKTLGHLLGRDALDRAAAAAGRAILIALPDRR